jgi:hypothetical protein
VEKVLSLSGEALRQRILDLHTYLEGRQSMTSNANGSLVSEGRDAYSFSIASASAAATPSLANTSVAYPGSSSSGQNNSVSKRTYTQTQTPLHTNLLAQAHAGNNARMDNYSDDDNALSNHSMQNMLQAHTLGAQNHAQALYGPPNPRVSTGTGMNSKTKFISSVASVDAAPSHVIEKVHLYFLNSVILMDSSSFMLF